MTLVPALCGTCVKIPLPTPLGSAPKRRSITEQCTE
jgi:hypothetical protein